MRSKTLRELQRDAIDLAERVASMRKQGYHASADVLAVRQQRVIWQIEAITEHMAKAEARKAAAFPVPPLSTMWDEKRKGLVTPSNLAQFEPAATKTLLVGGRA